MIILLWVLMYLNCMAMLLLAVSLCLYHYDRREFIKNMEMFCRYDLYMANGLTEWDNEMKKLQNFKFGWFNWNKDSM